MNDVVINRLSYVFFSYIHKSKKKCQYLHSFRKKLYISYTVCMNYVQFSSVFCEMNTFLTLFVVFLN